MEVAKRSPLISLFFCFEFMEVFHVTYFDSVAGALPDEVSKNFILHMEEVEA